MTWALVDDQFYDHPKVLALLEHDGGLAAIGLWALALGWAKRHADPHVPDEAGHIPASLPRRLGGSAELARLLVAVGLWQATGDGWIIHDFAHWQQLGRWASRSDRAVRAARKRWDASSQETDAPSNAPGTSSQQIDAASNAQTMLRNGSHEMTALQHAEEPEVTESSTISAASSQQIHAASNARFMPNTSPHLTSPKDLQELLRSSCSSSEPKVNGSDGDDDPVRRPAVSATKAVWVTWATAHGVTATVARRSTKDHLAELADGKITTEQLGELADGGRDEPGVRPDVDRLCQHLADRIEQQSGRRPHIGKLWRQSARYLLDIDGLCEDRVHAAIDWCQDDEFWRPNILSMSKLREKYVVLQAAARRRPGTSAADPLVPRSGLWD